MQDDVTAGAQWLVSQGIADPARICVYGASYGGYAAMWALAKTPDLFRCGISFAGVSDLAFMFRDDSDVNDSATGRITRRRIVGDPKTHKQQFDEVSPVKQAAAFRVPVLVVHGDQDARVPIRHSEQLVEALQANGKQVEWIKLKGEGHGIWKSENRQLFYQALFDFLARNIGLSTDKAGIAAASAKTTGPAGP
jgi:dipeptidyl aminopeptidase/acylaminoacyl peptidase